MTLQLIETKTLGTAAATIEFTSIPQTFTDLLVVYSIRSVDSIVLMDIAFNGSTANFSARYLQGNGSGVGSASNLPRFIGAAMGVTANTFGNSQLYIPNYTGSTNKSWSVDNVSEANQTQSYQEIVAGLWSNTAAITSLAITMSSGNIASGSTVSVYGILKGSSGGVVVS
jgi:hypothetical protein